MFSEGMERDEWLKWVKLSLCLKDADYAITLRSHDLQKTLQLTFHKTYLEFFYRCLH